MKNWDQIPENIFHPWKVGTQENPKIKRSQHQNPFCPKCRQYFLSRNKKLPAPFGALPAHFLRGPEKSKKSLNFTYFPWFWVVEPLEGWHQKHWPCGLSNFSEGLWCQSSSKLKCLQWKMIAAEMLNRERGAHWTTKENPKKKMRLFLMMFSSWQIIKKYQTTYQFSFPTNQDPANILGMTDVHGDHFILKYVFWDSGFPDPWIFRFLDFQISRRPAGRWGI